MCNFSLITPPVDCQTMAGLTLTFSCSHRVIYINKYIIAVHTNKLPCIFDTFFTENSFIIYVCYDSTFRWMKLVRDKTTNNMKIVINLKKKNGFDASPWRDKPNGAKSVHLKCRLWNMKTHQFHSKTNASLIHWSKVCQILNVRRPVAANYQF